jgi:hypothetical protein
MEDFTERLTKILQDYPEISDNWLLNGKGPVYVNADQKPENNAEELRSRLRGMQTIYEEQVRENARLRQMIKEGKNLD